MEKVHVIDRPGFSNFRLSHGCNATHLVYRLLVVASVVVCGWCSFEFASPSVAFAQPPQAEVDGLRSIEITEESIDSEIAVVEANPNLDDTQKASLVDLLRRAKKNLQDASAQKVLSTQYAQMSASAPEDKLKLQNELETLTSNPFKLEESATLQQLSQQLVTNSSKLTEATEAAATFAAEPARRRSRLTEIPALLADAESELGKLTDQLQQPAAGNESAIESDVRETFLKAKIQQLSAQIEAFKQEQLAYVATAEVIPLRKQIADTNLSQLRRAVSELEAEVNEREKQAVKATTNDLKKTADKVPEELRELAEQNVELATTQQVLLTESSKAKQRLLDIQAAFEDVKSDLTTSEERVEAVGLTEALGLMLRQKQQTYLELGNSFRPRSDLSEKIKSFQLASFRLEDELSKADKLLTEEDGFEIEWDVPDIDWDSLSIEQAKWVLLNKRKKLIESTLEEQNAVLQTMLTGDTQRRELSQAIERFDSFVDSHMFWTRSAPALTISEFSELPANIEWMTDQESWYAAALQPLATISANPFAAIALILLSFLLLVIRSRIRRIITSQGDAAMHINASFSCTLSSLGASVVSAAVWPVCFATLYFLLVGTRNSEPFIRGLGFGFGIMAVFIASRDLLKEVCRPKGLAEAHFGWSDELRLHLRRHLRWYTLFGGIGIFLMVWLHENSDAAANVFSLRVNSTALFLLTAAFHHVIFKSSSPLYSHILNVAPTSVISRNRGLIWAVTVIFPIACAAMSIAGYLETTYRLGRSLQLTFLLLVLLVIVLGITSRWLTLYRRDVARRKMRERWQESRNVSEATSIANEAGIVLEDEEEADLPALDQQTRKTIFVLVSIVALVGLGFIWQDVVPAIGYFDEVELWTVGTGDDLETVTLLDVVTATAGVVVILYITRNLPSVLELLFLSRTNLDSGARYAYTTLLRYAVTVVGFFLVLSLLSIPYNQLGWLLAAASVGLGFGLQEIVANFVSGIILLLERPVRVGDVVTIDGTTGIVSRIQMRATTVTNWDRKELVIPNKDLITEKLLNWSLSNVINRLTIEVGVAYGSDPDKVLGILYKVVKSNPHVLQEPPPLINFETFGDSSLNFVVRFFLEKLDNRITVTHQVNSAIAKAFQEAGIEIPFPQRDLHIIREQGEEPESSSLE